MQKIFALLLTAGLFISACKPASTLPPANTANTAAPSTATPTVTFTSTASASPAPTTTPTFTPTITPQPSPTPRPTATRTPAAAYANPLYLIQRLDKDEAQAIIPAPEMKGLHMRQAADGISVEYLGSNDKVLLTAEAQQLDLNDKEGELIGEILYELYNGRGAYTRNAIYPRFHFPIAGVKAGFYGLDQTLSYAQIQKMQEALQVFSRPDFMPMQPYIFDQSISYIILDTIGSDNLGANFIGTQTVILDRKYLFGNKYLLASVIAHEGGHTLQGKVNRNHLCENKLRFEVGDRTMPANFAGWNAEQVMMGVSSGTLGAYHISYWVLSKLGFNNLDSLRQVIQTGRIQGQPLISGC